MDMDKITAALPHFGAAGTIKPLKTTINFVGVEKNESIHRKAIIGVIVIVILAACFSKFAVIDRYQRLWDANAQVMELQDEWNEGIRTIEESDELSDTYAHYTWDGISEEEKERPKRVDAANLVQYIGSMSMRVNNYTLSGRTLEVNITSDSLEQVSRLAMDVEKRSIVDSCSVQMAQRGGQYNQNAQDGVEAQLTIYLKSVSESGQQEGVDL